MFTTTICTASRESPSSNTCSSVNTNTSVTTQTANNNINNSNVSGGGPLQEIIVNPSSMLGGWRVNTNGSIIPSHDLISGTLQNVAAQKRGSDRLFQYLEAEGSDPEDYARYMF